MKIIGITGGVGAGKTQILKYIEEHYSCRIIRADEAAHLLEEPGQECYEQLVTLLGKEILQQDGMIDKAAMADRIFGNPQILEQVNAIIHPAVKQYILEQINYEKKAQNAAFFFIEAALLIEEHYDEIVDELWYIHTDEAVRRQRLAQNRQYSDEKTASIMRGQLSEAEFRRHCKVVITNNGDLEDPYQQINKIMGEQA